MKKLFLFLAIPLLTFFLTACHDNDSKTTAVDSTRSDTTAKAVPSNCAPGDSSQIGYWQIPDSIADSMITNVGRSGKGSGAGIRNRRDNIIKLLKDSFKVNYVGPVSARYRVEDEDRYRTLRCIAPGDSSGSVAQYFTNIYKVKIKTSNPKGVLTTSYAYYDMLMLCPPPDPCLMR